MKLILNLSICEAPGRYGTMAFGHRSPFTDYTPLCGGVMEAKTLSVALLHAFTSWVELLLASSNPTLAKRSWISPAGAPFDTPTLLGTSALAVGTHQRAAGSACSNGVATIASSRETATRFIPVAGFIVCSRSCWPAGRPLCLYLFQRTFLLSLAQR
jgi:hypothetical protein